MMNPWLDNKGHVPLNTVLSRLTYQITGSEFKHRNCTFQMR